MKKKKNSSSLPIQKEAKKNLTDCDPIIFTKVSDEELKKRRVNVYPYLM